jgi:serine/threonine protein kinase
VTSSEAATSRVGELLADKYRVVRFLGEGGMGTVYEAQHEVVGRRFAVKFLHAELAQHKEILERFKREARAAGALESENIAQVVDFGQAADGIPYMVMELLVGEDLARFLAREGPLPVVRAVNLIIQACRGLDAAHAAGIIHRDLKPENLFVCRRGDGSDLVKILDFGIAKLALGGADGPAGSLTRTGSTMGTPFYMSPEQARGAKEVDHRADIYGLGVILFEALTAQKPHPGDSYNEILYHILTQPPTSVATLRSGLPSDLLAVMERTLSFEPGLRPASAMELARALTPYAGRQVTPVHSQFELRVTRESAAAREPSPEPGGRVVTATPILARRRPGRWIVAATVLALVGGLSALLLSRKDGASDSAPAKPAPAPLAAPSAASPSLPAPPPSPTEVKAVPSVEAPQPAPKMEGKDGKARGEPARRAASPRAGRKDRAAHHGPVFDNRNPY